MATHKYYTVPTQTAMQWKAKKKLLYESRRYILPTLFSFPNDLLDEACLDFSAWNNFKWQNVSERNKR